MGDAMVYEELLCRLFNCSLSDNPLGYASAAAYDDCILDIEKGEGFELRAGLIAVLRQFQLNQFRKALNVYAPQLAFMTNVLRHRIPFGV